MGRLREFLRDRGTHVDVAACRALLPELMTFEGWCVHSGFDKKVFESPGYCAVM